MAEWKKVVVSGSSAALKEVTNDPGIATATHLTSTRLTGSFTGSFRGKYLNSDGTDLSAEWDGTRDGNSQITGSGTGPSLVLSGSTGTDLDVKKNATIGGTLSATIGINSNLTSSNLTTTRVTFAGANGELVDDAGLTFGSDTLTAKQIINDSTVATVTQVANTRITGSFSGSFKGLGTDLDLSLNTTIPAGEWDGTLNVSDISNLEVAQITGSLVVSGSGNTSVKSDQFDVIAEGNITMFGTVGEADLTLGGSKTVVKVPGNLNVAGTASFTHASNLSVSDKYILLNSGSTSGGSGGIVVQEPSNQDVGQIFGFKSGSGAFDNITRRWGVADNYDADTSTDFTPEAFMSAVVVGGDNTVPVATSLYSQKGNIFIGTSADEIYIYGS
jgi:hypothetical protein